MGFCSNIFLLSFFSALYAVSFLLLTDALGKQLPPIQTSQDISEPVTKVSPSVVTVITDGEGDQSLDSGGGASARVNKHHSAPGEH
jgi:hypothetical protein